MIEKVLGLLPAQRELLEAEEKIVLFVGGLGSGKSRGLALKALMLGLENPGCMGLFVEPSFPMQRDIAVPAVKELLEELEVPYQFKSNDMVFHFAQTTLLMRSGDKPESLVGTNCAFALLDEPALQSEEVPKALLARLRHPKAQKRQLVCAGTPEGVDSWFYHWSLRPDIRVIRAKTTQNPFLPEDYVDQLMSRFTPEEVKSYIEGEFVSFSGAWFRIMPLVTGHDDLEGMKIYQKPDQTSGQLVLGVDTGGGLDRDACALSLVDKRDNRLVACWKDSRASIETMAKKAKILIDHFTIKTAPEFPGVYGTRKAAPPAVVIEKNGVGMATVQSFQKEGISYSTVSTTEGTRYAGLHNVRRAIDSGELFGPQELRDEAQQLVVEKGKYVGDKDLCMSIGFALNWITSNPYIAPVSARTREVLDISSRLGRKQTW